MKRLALTAKDQALDLEVTEGGPHTKVRIGDRATTVPRHSEVNEMTARGILRHMGDR